VKKPDKNWLEWTVFWGSLALLLAVFAYLAYAAVTKGDRPPQLTVTLGEAEPVPSGFGVPVLVSNAGDNTAESVRIEVTLEGHEERGQLLLAFVPQQATRRGWVTFRTRPDPARLRASILGYESR
jgi:uncharacterized protein (TIGR02588 family)